MKTFLAKIMGIGSAVWNFYAPILRGLFVSGASALLPVALDVVRSLADTSKSGEQKRESAVIKLRGQAVLMGIDASESLLRFTIESAVQRLRAND
jgi:hypothetical protein